MPKVNKDIFSALLDNNNKMTEKDMVDLTDYSQVRQHIFDEIDKAVKSQPAVSNQQYTLQITDTEWGKDPQYTSDDIVNAVKQNQTLSRPLFGKVELIDNSSGETIQKSSKRRIMNVPYFTDEGTFVMDGTEMAIGTQARLMPGVYTDLQTSGTPKAQINAGEGGGFRMLMRPKDGTFFFRFGTRHIPAYHVLKELGVSDDVLKERWGDLYKSNKNIGKSPGFDKWIQEQASKGHQFINKGMYNPPEEEQSLDDTKKGLRAWFGRKTLNPETTKETLGFEVDRVTPEVLLKTTDNIRQVYNGKRSSDNKDSLAFQNVLSAADQLSERIKGDKNGQMKQMLWKVTRTGDLKSLPTVPLDGHVSDLFVNSGLQQVLEQTNPLGMLDQATKVTWMGEGGITGTESAPVSARAVQPSYLGFIDTSRSPESLRVGLDMYLAANTKLGKDNKLYSQFINTGTGEKEWVDMNTAAKSTIGFPSYYKSDKNKKYVDAVDGEKISVVPKKKVQYVLPEPEEADNIFTSTIPGKSGVKSMRQLMGAKFFGHALPLSEPEKPLVETVTADGKNVSEALGKYTGAKKSPVDGIIKSVGPKSVIVTDNSGQDHKIPLYNYRPYARTSYNHNYPKVQKGDKVTKNQVVASSDFSDEEGNLAMQKNLRIGYMTDSGMTFEDSIVISEDAAKKLKAKYMKPMSYEEGANDKLDKKIYTSRFPTKYKPEQLKKVDDKGVVKPGQILEYGDPVYLGIRRREADKSALDKPLITDASVTWPYQHKGKVVRTVPKEKGASADIIMESEVEEADKLSLPFGAKGVTGKIIPTSSMPQDEKGRPLEVLLHPLSIGSRVNPGQMSVAALGKVASETGKRFRMPGTQEPGYLEKTSVEDFEISGTENKRALNKMALKELENAGLKEKENIYDPRTGKTIPEVTTGVLPFYRMVQLSEKKGKGRSTGGYTVEGTPARGSEKGAKHLGPGEYNAFRSHGAEKVLSDLKLIHSQKNDNFWSQLKRGQTPVLPYTPHVYQKFRDMLRGSGINLRETGEGDTIYAMTDQQAKNLTGNRKIKNPKTYDLNMREYKSGLFDPSLVAGKFGYIELPEPMLNPIMEKPVRVLLDKSGPQLNKIISGEDEGSSLYNRLTNIDVDQELKKAKQEIKTGSKSKRDKAYKKHAYLQAMKDEGVHPKDFMLTRLPVIPSEHRPIMEMKDKEGHLVTDPNKMYRDLMFKIDDYNDVKNDLPEMVPEAKSSLYNSLKAAIGTAQSDSPKLQNTQVRGILQQLTGKGSPKESMIQRRLIGGDMDLYGLSVIVPDMNLGLDEVGIPENQAWEVYQPFIVRDLVKKGVPSRQAVEETQNRTDKAKVSLENVITERPVLLNRAPTLHKYGVQAFDPKLKPGNAIRINPYITGGYNADFDGDLQKNTVYIYVDHNLTYRFKNEGYITYFGKHITPEDLENMKIEPSELKEQIMSFKHMKTPVYQDGEVFAVNLRDFPYDPDKYIGSKDHIDFYEVPPGIKVIAYDEKTSQPVWADVHGWSYHKNKEIWTVNLKNKHQLITDDDPRAVYGIKRGALEFIRNRPEDALGMMVPITKSTENMKGCEGEIQEIPISNYLSQKNTAKAMKDRISLNSNTGYFVGAMAGDGWVVSARGEPTQLYLSGIEEPVVNKVQETSFLFMKNSDLSWKEYKYEGSYGKSKGYRCSSRSLGVFVLNCIGKKSTGKHLPRFWHKASREFKIGLLSGLLDTAGTVSISHGKAKPQLGSNICSNSLDLLQDTQHMLRSLGIHSRLTFSKKTSQGNDSWILSISSIDLYKIKEELVCVKEKIIESFNSEVVPDSTSGASIKNDLIPVSEEIAEYLKKTVRSELPEEVYYDKNRQTYRTRKVSSSLYSVLTKAKGDGYMTRYMAEKAVEYIPYEEREYFQKWIDIVNNKDITWSPVVSIENTGVRENGYDLTVPGFETFMSVDGIILSNTMSFTVPVTQSAVQEANQKMKPSKNLITPTGSPAYTLDQDLLQGLYLMTKNPEEGSSPFRSSKEEASLKSKAAYNAGKVDIDTPVMGT